MVDFTLPLYIERISNLYSIYSIHFCSYLMHIQVFVNPHKLEGLLVFDHDIEWHRRLGAFFLISCRLDKVWESSLFFRLGHHHQFAADYRVSLRSLELIWAFAAGRD